MVGQMQSNILALRRHLIFGFNAGGLCKEKVNYYLEYF